jgi:hypothetical protein
MGRVHKAVGNAFQRSLNGTISIIHRYSLRVDKREELLISGHSLAWLYSRRAKYFVKQEKSLANAE